ncbi:hypothetical protein P153DRAFT_424403 [Dothidotthia symphoricarpi CBS 119687]|uniref:Uncharacterized protein n=1 Tax=Dothidotthia symphoricarpi CBS 119687 TaxID=1392245 RepID=A0A6A6A775_9PLEO|nr:uncharacterized protein P153DRAFT_424403 [Dothidotthia symphoricarpi CBS 119687]KAF2127075.1 hypothetical protein P153DRAFT_424403 [Dothidotthia symphoricarpi CBS 119687]
MGGRLSMPKGPDGLSETSRPTSGRLHKNRGIINGRTVMAPLAAFTMAGLLFVYARTSIRAAKLNAKKHREADGGQISWHKESLRRHGQLDRIDDDRGSLKEALLGDLGGRRKKGSEGESEKGRTERSGNDEELRRLMGKKD